MHRAILLVLDGCGAGAAPDAAEFGDPLGPSTLKHVWEAVGGFSAPNLAACGFLAAAGIDIPATRPREGWGTHFGRLQPVGQGKDSVTGHWEMMGIVVSERFPTYPDGFPIPLVKAFESKIGKQTLGNRAASGTAIIQDLGELHCETGFPILYTSADSVFQIACHEDVVPIEQLYDYCRAAREICVPPHHVQRVIARPFVGDTESGFVRTERRKDFPLDPPRNFCDDLGEVWGIGVVPELFGGRGFRPGSRTQSNPQHATRLREALDSETSLIFANFEDFDMLYGHRNDAAGFARCLEEFDPILGEVVTRLRPDDLLILTADHGNDPTDESTDHSREFVPVSVVRSDLETQFLGDRRGLMSIGATIAQHLGVAWNFGDDVRSLLTP